jgi:iron complex transport system ATP-binding protein
LSNSAAAASGESGALRFEAIGVRFGDRVVLKDVSFEVGLGEVVGLLGCNGAGKTTLVRAATRSMRPDSGQVTVAGHPVQALTRRALATRVATVPQDVHVPFPFLAGELVLMGRTPHQSPFGFESSRDLELARCAMARVGIAELADRPVDRLSGGERQLVFFARALVQESDWLLLDEPTAFLDLRHRIDLLRVVREFARAGGGALVVSHDLDLAARVCDRLVVLAHGRVIAEGEPAQVLRPEILERAFGMRADVLEGPDGRPVVVARIEESEAREARGSAQDSRETDC